MPLRPVKSRAGGFCPPGGQWQKGDNKMDIIIRDIDPAIIRTIDEKAKQIHISRQQYLLQQINRMATIDVFREERDEYSTLVKNIAKIIGQNTEQLNDFTKAIEELKELIEKR